MHFTTDANVTYLKPVFTYLFTIPRHCCSSRCTHGQKDSQARDGFNFRRYCRRRCSQATSCLSIRVCIFASGFQSKTRETRKETEVYFVFIIFKCFSCIRSSEITLSNLRRELNCITYTDLFQSTAALYITT